MGLKNMCSIDPGSDSTGKAASDDGSNILSWILAAGYHHDWIILCNRLCKNVFNLFSLKFSIFSFLDNPQMIARKMGKV